jgi:hypothetical protein
LVRGGTSEVVYRFEVSRGLVAFLYYVGTSGIPAGGVLEWVVDGEAVELKEYGIKFPIRLAEAACLGSVEEPLPVNPPIVVQREVVFRLFSPVDVDFSVYCDGEVYELPLSRDELRSTVEEAVEAGVAPVLTQESRKPEAKPSTFVDEWKNVSVNGTWEMCDIKGSGTLEECFVLTTTTDFNLIVEVDGRREYEGSYSDYEGFSRYIDEILAMQSDGNYRVHLSRMIFKKSLRIYIRGTLTVTKAFLKANLEVV